MRRKIAQINEKTILKNKEIILTKIDAVIANLCAKSNGSEQSHRDIQAFETIRRQYENEDIKGAQHTYFREMLPSECSETLGYTRRDLA